MQAVDELLQNMKFASQHQQGDYSPFVYGHVANYDGKTHRVRLYLPSVRNEDDVPVLTSWMPLGGPGGAGWGIQVAPKGGATVDNPTAGELCIVQRIDRGLGAQAVASMVWNQVNTPPFTDLAPGEIGIKVAAGASIKLDKNNNITIAGAKDMTATLSGNLSATVQGTAQINSTGDCTLNSSGNLTLSAAGSLAIIATASTIKAVGGVVRKLVTDAFQSVYNNHTHNLPIGTSGVPNQQMDNTQLTTILEAE